MSWPWFEVRYPTFADVFNYAYKASDRKYIPFFVIDFYKQSWSLKNLKIILKLNHSVENKTIIADLPKCNL